jgi:hypothetical protein
MSKAYKYSLGGTIRDVALQLAEAVFLAYEERDNLPSITMPGEGFTKIVTL